MELRVVNADNWRGVASIVPREDERHFAASVAHYLNLCHYGDDWRPLAPYGEGAPVGFALWGFDAEEESYWIGGLIIGAEQLRAAMEALLDHFAAQPGYREAALSCDPENTVARRLYASLGFGETGELTNS